jgi:acetyl-CoA C-acetyltransferase
VTGGLPFSGGAGSNYMLHSIATMTDVLREDPGSYGLVSGVGMHMTKHVYAAYSTAPGAVAPPGDLGLDAVRTREITASDAGLATVVTYTVAHQRDGSPEWGLVIADLPDGTRAYAKVLDAGLLADAESRELVGQAVTLSTDGSLNTATW